MNTPNTATFEPTGPTAERIPLKGMNVMTPEGAAQAIGAWMKGDRMVIQVHRAGGTYVYYVDDCMIGGAR